MAEVARKYPDQYERISKFISDIGRKASYFQGESLTLSDNKGVIDKAKIMAEMDLEIEEASKNTPDKEEFEKQKLSIWEKYNDRIQKETTREALAKKNNLAYSVVSGARGKPPQLKMMLSTPGLYTDANDNVIPLFIRNSFAEGLRPAEYLAGTYGARKSVLCLHQDTHVRLPDGDSLPIKYINPGMYVLGADKEGNTFPVRVVRVYDQGLQPVKRYIFRRGCGGGRHEVVCTDKHAFLQNDYKTYNQAYNRFKKGKAPRPKAELIHSKAIYSIGEKRARQAAVLAGGMRYSGRKEPYALMLGILTGDGCLTDSDLRIRLSCADESMINDLAGYMYGLNLKIADRRTADNFDWEIVADNYTAADNKSIQKGVRGFVANARMSHKQILIDEGLAFCSAETKKLPTNIHTWDNESTASYIAGLLATDGSIYFDANTGYPRVSFAMTAKDVIFGLHKLLQHRFGVYGTEISFRDSGGFGSSSSLRKNRLWEFSVTTDTSIKRLLSVLPPIPGCKENKRQQALLSNIKQKNPYPKARLEFVKDEGFAHCYDIEVDHPDHLFVLDSGLITSNSTKRATAKGGDLAKQMVQSAANLVVSENDCGAANGISLGVDDKSLRGRVLARDIGKVPAGTVLDKHALSNIRNQGVEKLIVRSPMTCQSKEGVCARCMGLNALGKFPAKGESVGITAAQAIGEPICLHEDTLVRMADWTTKKIKDIKPGEYVLGSDMAGFLTPTRVVNVFHNGPRHGYRTRVRKGYGAGSEIIELLSTKEHKVLSYQGRNASCAIPEIQPIHKVKNRQWVYLSKGLKNPSEGHEEPLAVLLGILIGDGCYNGGVGSKGLALSCYDEQLEEFTRDLLSKYGLNLRNMQHGEFRISMADQYSNTEVIDGVLIKNYIKAKLIKEGMWGQGSGSKTLPLSIHTWNNQSIAALIGGLVATDGWVTASKRTNTFVIGFGSNSKKLLIDVKFLLEKRFGIYCSQITGKNKPKGDGTFYATNYTLTVSGAQNIKEFHSQIHIPGCKQSLLDNIVKKLKVNSQNRGRYSVISQEYIGEIDTWDIEVDNATHLFSLANSLIVSNTQGALNCLAVDTKVLMADYAEKCIQDIKPGEMVMGADVNGNIFPTKVTHVWDQGLQPVQRRVYKMGQTKNRIILESTEAHPVLSNRKTYGRVPGKDNLVAEKLVAGYKHKNLAAVLPVNNISHGIDERWAVFIGAYLGDGIRWDSNSEKFNSVTFSCADETEVQDLNQMLKSLNVQLVKCARSHDWRVSLLEDDITQFTDVTTGQVLKGYRNPCKLKLVEYGLNDTYAHEKTIHPRVWQWSNQSVADLVAGFIATDGSVYKNSDGHIGIAFTSTSKRLLLELQKLMRLKLCVYSSALTQVGKAGTGNRNHTQWQFTVARLDQIKRLFSFIENKIPGVKNQRIKDYISNASYTIRNPDIFYRAVRDNEAEQDLGFVQCYDITVEHKDSLFVLANSLIVSNTKHQGGAAGVSNRFSGFSVINQFVQTPDTFPDKAVLSKKDGQVNSIIAAPQGGYYITVDNEPHYVAPGYPVTVKVGDKVEAGDSMSEGLADPGEVVELRGLGAGRKYYSDRLKQLLDDSGMEADRRNTELMARAALDHLQITDIKDDDNEYLPDDVVSYSYFSNRYTPPKDTVKVKTDKAVGNYLQSPALHYTIGTRITPKISKDLSESGFNEVFASPSSPTFKPHMVRLRAATHHGTDWLASMHTSYLKKQISDSAIRGEDSNIESNIHFAPRLAIGTNFGESIANTGKF